MIVGKKVVLRAWSADDIPALQLMRNDLQLQRQLMARPKGNSVEQVRDWLNTRTKSADGLLFIIANTSTDKAVGYMQIVGMDLVNGSGTLGICIAPDSQGKGYGGEAIALLESYLLSMFQFRKIMMEVLAENVVAISLYAKHGYREAGRLHSHVFTGSGYDDVVIMEKMLRP